MRHVPERRASLQIGAVFGLFFLGPWAALQASTILAPGSEIVQTASALAFVLVFVVGTLGWAGIGALALIPGGLRARLRRGATEPADSASSGPRATVPPGYGAYVVLGLAAGVTVGLLAGVVTESTILRAMFAWVLVGGAYGMLLWAAAHHGYLPFCDPE
ncbi:MAG: hypothetical protein ACODAB_08435 [Gemmatimonadota bacterium]